MRDSTKITQYQGRNDDDDDDDDDDDFGADVDEDVFSNHGQTMALDRNATTRYY